MVNDLFVRSWIWEKIKQHTGMAKLHPNTVSPNVSQAVMLATHLPDSGRCCGDSLTLHQRTLVTLSSSSQLAAMSVIDNVM